MTKYMINLLFFKVLGLVKVLQYFTDGSLLRLERFRWDTYSLNGNGVELKAIRVSGQKLGSFMNFSFDYLKNLLYQGRP